MASKIKIPRRATIEAQGQRIALLRKATQTSNVKLAEETEIAAPTISQYVHAAKGTISAEHLRRLAKAFGVTIDYLVTGDVTHLSDDIKNKLLNGGDDDDF